MTYTIHIHIQVHDILVKLQTTSGRRLFVSTDLHLLIGLADAGGLLT